MISMGLVFVAGIVGVILILFLLLYYSGEQYDSYKVVNKTFSTFFLLGVILLAFFIYCKCYGWEPQEEKTEYKKRIYRSFYALDFKQTKEIVYEILAEEMEETTRKRKKIATIYFK
jgi:apolipoprotein N-acyltransferase